MEAALGIAAVLACFGFLIQASAVGVEYLRLLAIAADTAELASASGQLSLRVEQARDWANQQAPAAEIVITHDQRTVHVQASQQLTLLGGSWRPLVSATVDAVLIDQAAWT